MPNITLRRMDFSTRNGRTIGAWPAYGFTGREWGVRSGGSGCSGIGLSIAIEVA